jgi:hypothetical protein
MHNRYIREGNGLFPAMIVDDHYKKPDLKNLKPYYYVIDEKLDGTLLEVLEYYLLDITKAKNFDGMLAGKQKLIKSDFIVKDGQALTAQEMKALKKEIDYDI